MNIGNSTENIKNISFNEPTMHNINMFFFQHHSVFKKTLSFYSNSAEKHKLEKSFCPLCSIVLKLGLFPPPHLPESWKLWTRLSQSQHSLSSLPTWIFMRIISIVHNITSLLQIYKPLDAVRYLRRSASQDEQGKMSQIRLNECSFFKIIHPHYYI